ncbi:hypothetical protein [Acinetobacter oleivorans]|uniref:hypothetical protein n=1 Tax=Acinetobacter oleivorans TaxID=1148157 RepID=UPI002B25DB7E|nr:hypothetical protein [Acinetobacter oleivorans]WQF74982.1 hypothetical protein OKW95_19965 [Acinetobacter oleivorans]
MDTLSLVSAIASIISLGLALGLNSEKWKKWLLPFTYICIGVSVGRITSNLNEIVDNIKADPVLPGALFIIISCLFASCYIIKVIHNTFSDVPVGFLFALFVAGLFGIKGITKVYIDSERPQLSSYELIEYAEYKEKSGQLSLAKEYLNKALENTEAESEKRFIKEKLENITNKQLGK